MSIALQTALISAGVALIIALLSTYITLRLERRRWLINLKTSYETERYKARLAAYPRVFEILLKLSHGSREAANAEIATQVAYELNDWFHSVGGMCAEAETRGAILELRGLCFTWGREGKMPDNLYDWRNASILLLRRDLDIEGLESTDIEKIKPILEKLREGMAKIK
jgi:hypothetical protein